MAGGGSLARSAAAHSSPHRGGLNPSLAGYPGGYPDKPQAFTVPAGISAARGLRTLALVGAPGRYGCVEGAPHDARISLLGVAYSAGFVDILPGKTQVGRGRQIIVLV
jgi:hypothetical protein